ncbi:MAG: hypothetical protein ACTSRP_26925 [Candidatus Helarchaeota archaeon]
MIQFLKRYILHHLLLGIIMIIEGIFLIIDLKIIWGIIYTIIGIVLFIDDLIAETMGKSMMEKLPQKVKNENTLKIIGLIVFIITTIWFLYLFYLY